MTRTATAAIAPAIPTHVSSSALIQRACACGSNDGHAVECADCAADEKLGLQPKLAIAPPDDPWEQEADRIADRVVAAGTAALVAPIAPTPLAQGQSTRLSRMGDDEIRPKASPTAATANAAAATPSPARQAGAAVASGGHPLSRAERTYFEPRFGLDLSHVRLHADATAGDAAGAISARAYTLRNHIAFAPGQYNPGTTDGRHLIAHELAHTLQQERTCARLGIQRRSFFDEIAGLFRGDDFDDHELRAYLEHLENTGEIEDFTDSDNKARAVSRRLAEGEELFGHEDTASLRTLLIREMLSGYTGNDDENAILSILGGATLVQLKAMFGRGGLTPEALDDKFQGAQQRQFDRFLETRFRGGREAIALGQIEPIHRPVAAGPFSIERAQARLREVEHLLAEALEVERERDRYDMLRRMLDEQSSDAAAATGLKAREEERLSANMNRRPLDIRLVGGRIEFRVRFHVRFEDAAMANRAGDLATSLRDGIAQVWNTDFNEGALEGRSFVMIPDIVPVAADAPRDHLYWLVSVRPTDAGPATHPGCELPDLVEGVPTSVTDTLCDGGLISIPPSHVNRPGILGHETLHLFGLVDRYMAITSMTEEGGDVTAHENVPTRQTAGRPDPLGSEDGTILEEDLSFVLKRQGVYDREIERRLGGASIVALTIEADRLREAIRLGRDPRSLIRPRENFNDRIIQSAEDI